MKKTISTAIVAAMLLRAGGALAVDPGPACESAKLGTSAKYAQCRLKADAKAAKAGTLADYSKCNLEKFTSAETKGDGMCPTTGDQSSIQGFLDACTESVAGALGGDALPLDVATCNADLATCESDLGICDDNLAACEAAPSCGPSGISGLFLVNVDVVVGPLSDCASTADITVNGTAVTGTLSGGACINSAFAGSIDPGTGAFTITETSSTTCGGTGPVVVTGTFDAETCGTFSGTFSCPLASGTVDASR